MNEKLSEAIEKNQADQAFSLLQQMMETTGSALGDVEFALLDKALSDCLTETQILDFHAQWGMVLKRTSYSQRYLGLIVQYKGLEFSDESRNVVVGRNGYLYLAGGRQSVLDYITGRKSPSPESYDNFRENLKRRNNYCASRNIKFQHIIFPDKQSVEVDSFPLESYRCLGDQYVEKCMDLHHALMYPRKELGAGAFHKKDTHMSDVGYCRLTAHLLKRLDFSEDVCSDIQQELITCLSKSIKYSGDLGSKMIPEEFDVKNDIVPGWNFYHVKNNLGVSNDGLAELYINNSSLTGMRVVIFGDSFSRLHSLFLSRCFKEVAFFRTRFFHEDVVEMAKPDLVITGNAERYLSSVVDDALAPNFFLYPLLKGIGHAPDQDYAIAMNAFLSYGKPNYARFKEQVRSGKFLS